MAEGPRRVAAVVRHRETVLVCGDRGRAGSAPSLPTAPVGAGDAETARRTLLDSLGVSADAVERRAEPIAAADGPVSPFLVTVEDRPTVPAETCPGATWVSPSVLRAATDSPWRAAYEAVAPTVETVAADAERGSTAIAADAIWVLRDAAGRAAATDGGLEPVESVAEELLDARPAMAALANRVDRAMAGAETPADVERAASDGLVRAFDADAAAAELAAETVGGGRVLTLSRSGTVREALLAARPSVVVLASRPGGEGRAVVDELAGAGLDAEGCPDADVYARLRAGDVDAVLVGADAVTADGGVVNKVGTRAAGLAAERAAVPCYVACASDKIRPMPSEPAAAPPGSPPLEPGFDWTPPRLVTAVLTERGRLAADDVAAIAAEHRALAAWRD